jgi:hypothetical protein
MIIPDLLEMIRLERIFKHKIKKRGKQNGNREKIS